MLYSTESPSSRLGCPVPPQPQAHGKPGSSPCNDPGLLHKSSAHKTKQVGNLAVSFFQLCIHQLTLTGSTEREMPTTSGIIQHPYKPSLREVQPFVLGHCWFH